MMAKKISSEMSNPQSLRALMVDDSEDDVLLIIRELQQGGYNPVYERVDTASAMKKALHEKQWDIILCDYKMPEFSAPSAIAVLKEANIDIPLIIISGTIGEETAVECMRLGAHDYFMKGKLSRLCPAIARELEEAKVRNKQKQAEETIRLSEERYRNIIESIEDGYVEVDFAGNWTFVNDVICKHMKYSREELLGMDFRKLHTERSAKRSLKAFGEVHQTGKPLRSLEVEGVRKDGTIGNYELSVSLMKDANGQPIGFRCISRDITERKQMEEALKQSDELFKSLFNHSLDGVFVHDFEGNILDLNKAALDKLGYDRDEILSLNFASLLDPAQITKAMQVIDELIQTGIQQKPAEYKLKCKDGSYLDVENKSSVVYRDGKPHTIMGIARDITERKQMEESLRQSEEKYRSILETIQEGYFEVDLAGSFTFINDSMCRLYGYPREELKGMNSPQYTDKETSKKLFQKFNHVYNTGEPFEEFNWQVIRKDRTKRYVEASASLLKDSSGKPTGFKGIIHDITERKQAEQGLQESEKYFKEITENSSDIIIITDKNGDIKYGSRSIERFTGYTPEEIIGRSAFVFIHPDDVERAVADYGKAILSVDSAIPNSFRIVRKDGSERYFEGLGRNLLDNPFVAGFIINVRDVTERKQTEKKLLLTLDILRKAIGTTIQVLVSALEARDPYTAGHQLRVADLARAIATEMELDQEKIDGIKLAGSIHDIGKLSIPAEILSKPTKLTNLEFALIKEHAQSGYDMLKDVESPWPLAQIVYQHHERMNGTGYPRNLKGDEILMEARIMAVADVVEAMASHRPYRPGLGIEAALEEIEKNKGIIYDDTVADACLKLFREKGYKLLV